MVKIVKDGLTLTVPNGAYKTQYAPAGWNIAEENKTEKEAEKNVVENIEKEKDIEANVEVDGKEDTDTDEEAWDEAEAEDDELELLEEKPIGTLKTEELKRLAELKGISIKGLDNDKKLREAIKALK